MTYTITDLFCGAGGSALGAATVAGAELVMAANHSALAIDTHAANFPAVEHDCADLSQVDPRRYRRTAILWASPECTNHSQARGRRRAAQRDLFTAPDPVAERSRATMFDVARFAEHHRYQAVIVENVIDAADWEMWPAWLHAMRCLGYRHRVVMLNSMHAPAVAAPRAPQSRDRLYVVFWRDGNRAPDLDVRPAAWCGHCGAETAARQWFKKPGATIGRYRAQYLYRCPACHNTVEPYAAPAAEAIDWTRPGQRIGDRTTPLRPATVRRIQAGLDKYATPALVPSGGTWRDTATPTTEPMPTRTTTETDALLVPCSATRGSTRPATEPMGTQTTRHDTALVVPYYRTATARHSDHPLPTVTTLDRFGLAFIAELRGGGSTARRVTEPLATVCAAGNHHMLVRNNGTTPAAGQMCTPMHEPARTITTTGHQSVVGWDHTPPALEDCTYRMLEVHEIAAAMAFTPGYTLKGNQRQRVAQLGNAVTPPAAEWLIHAVVTALDGAT